MYIILFYYINFINLNNFFYINKKLYDDNKILSLHNKLLSNENKILKNNINITKNLNYLFPDKTQVYLHIERIAPIFPIYHIGITFTSLDSCIRYDIGNKNKFIFTRRKKNSYRKIDEKYTIFWGYSNKTIPEIIEYEKTLNTRYLLGFNDCRHYTRRLALYTTYKASPIWNITDLIHDI